MALQKQRDLAIIVLGQLRLHNPVKINKCCRFNSRICQNLPFLCRTDETFLFCLVDLRPAAKAKKIRGMRKQVQLETR